MTAQNKQLARSALFVPGSRPERFAKALASGADIVIVDFEDAVEEALKAQARENLAAFLTANPQASVVVRINAADHHMHTDDIKFCGRYPGIAAVLLPKAETAEQVITAAECKKPIWPLIESAAGVSNLNEISGVWAVQRLTFGALDLALNLGVRASSAAAYRVFDQVRYQLLLNSTLHELEKPLDTVFPNIADSSGLSSFAQDARDLGFAGMLAIHPSQVEVIHQVFTPSASEIDWAKRVVEAASGAPGAFRLEGKMIDAPVIAEAERIVAFYGA
ncbi:CoA ester lyase [Pseudomonas sp. B21-056]|uniref:HpcH/HpaI aldolase/citrate lyase family protein n=1 Tax=Pseudomonas sp. B21-056 TaxID=2895495 RepID=UPI00222FB565|nr:CoA ester lyase [Pseudomonas sp. B21-056]UZE25910.1 CoA ester lyase [Pseudomonas sp. B21-056]